MSLRHIVFGSGVSASVPLVVSDVFATSLYTGNGSSQTINNGIDLAGKGGLVWIKNRGATGSHLLADTNRGIDFQLNSDTTGAHINWGAITGVGSTGFSLKNSSYNGTSNLYSSWTFCKAPKFFDVVTYTGNGVAGRQIPHNLGVAPGMIIVKTTSTTGDWYVYHRNSGAANKGFLNAPGRFSSDPWMNYTEPTSTVFTANSNGGANIGGVSYVAYLFAHDSSADGVIQCGSFTSDSSGNASINLGYRPQFVLLKLTNASGNWVITDSARGMPTGTGDKVLLANSATAETTTSLIDTSSTGFSLTGAGLDVTGIYMAIKSIV